MTDADAGRTIMVVVLGQSVRVENDHYQLSQLILLIGLQEAGEKNTRKRKKNGGHTLRNHWLIHMLEHFAARGWIWLTHFGSHFPWGKSVAVVLFQQSPPQGPKKKKKTMEMRTCEKNHSKNPSQERETLGIKGGGNLVAPFTIGLAVLFSTVLWHQ